MCGDVATGLDGRRGCGGGPTAPAIAAVAAVAVVAAVAAVAVAAAVAVTWQPVWCWGVVVAIVEAL
jgi:hypothetical protein